MSRASSDSLDALHGLLAEAQAEELQRNLARARLSKRVPDPEDPTGKRTIANPDYEPVSPKLLAVAIKFLKDNGIDAPATSPRFSGILDELKQLNIDPTLIAN